MEDYDDKRENRVVGVALFVAGIALGAAVTMMVLMFNF